MNNRGWGLSTLLGFLAVFGMFFVIVAILYNKNFSDINKIDEKPKTISEYSSDEKIEINDEKYIDFENKLVKVSKKYMEQKGLKNVKNKIIITLNDLISEKLLDEIIDPRTNEVCNGYVIYEKNPKGYISCIGSYQTYNYNEEFE